MRPHHRGGDKRRPGGPVLKPPARASAGLGELEWDCQTVMIDGRTGGALGWGSEQRLPHKKRLEWSYLTTYRLCYTNSICRRSASAGP